jgi:hypothetical protein
MMKGLVFFSLIGTLLLWPILKTDAQENQTADITYRKSSVRIPQAFAYKRFMNKIIA